MAKKPVSFQNFRKWFKKLTHKQVFGLLAGFFALLVLPIAVFVVQKEVKTKSKAAELIYKDIEYKKTITECSTGILRTSYSNKSKGTKCRVGTYTTINFQCKNDTQNQTRSKSFATCQKISYLTTQASIFCNKNFPCPKTQKLWWFDNNSTSCQQKQFTGEYKYPGLYVFNSKKECMDGLSKRGPIASNTPLKNPPPNTSYPTPQLTAIPVPFVGKTPSPTPSYPTPQPTAKPVPSSIAIPSDITPPTFTIDGPYAINGQTCMRWINLVDNVSVYTDVWAKWKIDDGAWSSPTSENPYGCITAKSGTTHTYFVHAEDFRGNVAEKSATFTSF